MICKFTIGQEVICVRDTPPPLKPPVLEIGKTYTIINIRTRGHKVVLDLAGMGKWRGFRYERFRATNPIAGLRKIVADVFEKECVE